jgi:hypothetical protein
MDSPIEGTETITSFQKDEERWIFLEEKIILFHGVDMLFRSLRIEEESAKRGEGE